MNKFSGGQTHSFEEVWIKTELTDVESTAYFYIESEEGISIANTGPSSSMTDEPKAVSRKSEITIEDCIPSSKSISSPSRNNVSFSNNFEVQRKTHLAGKQYVCNECGKKFKGKARITRHLRFHSGEKPFECDECGMRFAQKCHIKPHKLTHTGEKPYSCDQCDAAFVEKSGIRRHQRKHTQSQAVENQFVCKECGKQCNRKDNLSNHRCLHSERLFECNECGTTYIRNSDLKSHKLTHTGKRPFACDECDAAFYRMSHLNRHRFIHSGEKPFECDECGMRFAQKCHIKPHKLTHTGEKPHSCDECDASFACKSGLKKHKRRHTGSLAESSSAFAMSGKRSSSKVHLSTNNSILVKSSEQ